MLYDVSALKLWNCQFLAPVAKRMFPSHCYFYPAESENVSLIGMHLQSTWSSLNNLGGVAIHGLPFDNPEASCPEQPFPILQSIVDTQVA